MYANRMLNTHRFLAWPALLMGISAFINHKPLSTKDTGASWQSLMYVLDSVKSTLILTSLALQFWCLSTSIIIHAYDSCYKTIECTYASSFTLYLEGYANCRISLDFVPPGFPVILTHVSLSFIQYRINHDLYFTQWSAHHIGCQYILSSIRSESCYLLCSNELRTSSHPALESHRSLKQPCQKSQL